jgi:hypothetical protein
VRFSMKLLCQSFGLASILLVMNYGDLLGGGDDVRMHITFPIKGIIAANTADIALLGFIVFGIFLLAQTKSIQRLATLALAIAIPPFIFKRTQALYPFAIHHHLLLQFTLLWAVLVVLLFYRSPAAYERLLRAGDAIGVCLAIFAFASIAQLLWIARWVPGRQQNTAAWASSPQSPRVHPLLVWIVFDELSYDQTFEHRAKDLLLPAFHSLREQSSLYTNVQPAGLETVEVIPSLLGGRVVNDVRFTLTHQFQVHDQQTSKWKLFDGRDTVFHIAQQVGWRTATVGWYNPYCTIYSDAIDSCYWNNLDQIDGPMSPQDGFVANTLLPLKILSEQLVVPRKADSDACTFDVRHRYQTFVDLRKHSLQLLRSDQADFIFLHLPVPHSPAIWDRKTNTYRSDCGGSYVDNLALADRTLGEFLQTLQASPRWKDTTMIVEGDHSWRVQLWDWLPAWTDEDQAASHGNFDTRPALLVHRPGQTSGAVNGSAWPLVQVHDLVAKTLLSEQSTR